MVLSELEEKITILIEKVEELDRRLTAIESEKKDKYAEIETPQDRLELWANSQR